MQEKILKKDAMIHGFLLLSNHHLPNLTFNVVKKVRGLSYSLWMAQGVVPALWVSIKNNNCSCCLFVRLLNRTPHLMVR